MIVKPSPRPLRRAAIDALVGLSLFVAFALGLMGVSNFGSSSAGEAKAAEFARVAAFTGPLAQPSAVETVAAQPAILVSAEAGPQSRAAAVMLLAGVFAILFSFNLAFFRHLRRVYTSPRRGGAVPVARGPWNRSPWSIPRPRP